MSGTSTKTGGFGGGNLGVMLVFAMSEEQEPGRGTAAEQDQRADDDQDQLELAFGGSGFRAFDGCAAFRFVLCHDRPGSLISKKARKSEASWQTVTRYKCPSAKRSSYLQTLR